MSNTADSPLGKSAAYEKKYNPGLLYAIPRKLNRDEIGVPVPVPFNGCDIWNAYEISWLTPKGKPQVAIGTCIFPCTTSNIIESKSFKLYLNSFNGTVFSSKDEVVHALTNDLSSAANGSVAVTLFTPEEFINLQISNWEGVNIDELDIETDCYNVNRGYLQSAGAIVHETLVSDLLKSNCLVTGQPDWASIHIEYEGPKIDHAGLLKYLISFRDHNEFHEQCVERIFMDIKEQCAPLKLTVYARYTRRGGLDINPFRSTEASKPQNCRLPRQ
ncbi:MAG: NADPH-dependent 7-cyano-7-deazaguanine reductase QueF [Chlamydiales bacterium]|nr:NADPH-dependent 7-cyano-7-deazaguanine reductase QueF [Chlamydiia bacterium]MCP5506863.1 NADPH-dependent 7-cyano-7-deazaguanine reductase QueF [Chlamydiales bacterium]